MGVTRLTAAEDEDVQAILEQALRHAMPYSERGKVATYIPELGKVNPKQLGVTIVTLSGDQWSAGDHNQPFTMQSISKTVALMMAVMDRGADYVFGRVGMEPTGDAFNSIIRLETIRPSKPL
ncbi:MAG: glutaminase, partial [Bacillota bacterium]